MLGQEVSHVDCHVIIEEGTDTINVGKGSRYSHLTSVAAVYSGKKKRTYVFTLQFQ